MAWFTVGYIQNDDPNTLEVFNSIYPVKSEVEKAVCQLQAYHDAKKVLCFGDYKDKLTYFCLHTYTNPTLDKYRNQVKQQLAK